MTLMSPHRTASLSDHRTAGSIGHRTPSASELRDAVRGDGTRVEEMPSGVFRVLAGGHVRGFVEEAGPVFVSLRGPSYDRAVEVHQALVFAQAVRAIVAP